jgi:hypothetical protein
MKKSLIIPSIVLSVLSLTALAIAQEPAPAVAPQNAEVSTSTSVSSEPAITEPATEAGTSTDNINALYTYGSVVRTGVDQVTIMEYDFEKDQDVEVSYTVTPQTVLQGIKLMEELKPNDDVEIMYQDVEGKRVAKIVSKSTDTENTTGGQGE